MFEILFNNIKPLGLNLIDLLIGIDKVKYARVGSTLVYDTLSHYVYDTPIISVSYNVLSRNGGTVIPTITYTLKRTKIGYSGAAYAQETISGTITSFTASGVVLNSSGATINSNGAVSRSGLDTTYKADTWIIMNVTINCTINGKSGSKTVPVYMQSNTYTESGGIITYDSVIAGSVINATVPASGGTKTATAANGSQKWSKTAIIRTYLTTKTQTIEAASSGTNIITPSHSSITAEGANLGTTITTRQTLKSQSVIWSGNGGKSTSNTMYIYQEANIKSDPIYEVTISSFSYADASGAVTISPNISINLTRYYTYTSGALSAKELYNNYTPQYLITNGSGATINTSTGTLTWSVNNTGLDREIEVLVTVGDVTKTAVAKQKRLAANIHFGVGFHTVAENALSDDAHGYLISFITPTISGTTINPDTVFTIKFTIAAECYKEQAVLRKSFEISTSYADIQAFSESRLALYHINDFFFNETGNLHWDFMQDTNDLDGFVTFIPYEVLLNRVLESFEVTGLPNDITITAEYRDLGYGYYCFYTEEYYSPFCGMAGTNIGDVPQGVNFIALPSTFLSPLGATKDMFDLHHYFEWFDMWVPNMSEIYP